MIKISNLYQGNINITIVYSSNFCQTQILGAVKLGSILTVARFILCYYLLKGRPPRGTRGPIGIHSFIHKFSTFKHLTTFHKDSLNNNKTFFFEDDVASPPSRRRGGYRRRRHRSLAGTFSSH